MRTASLLKSRDGFSLTELVIVMGIFVIILALAGVSFDRIISRSLHESKSAESEIEGIVGLEMLRRDLAQAGYGLPWDVTGVTYAEIILATGNPAPGVDSKVYNDAPGSPPRAVTSGDNAGFNGSDYLVVKSTMTGLNDTAKKWYMATFTKYTSNSMVAKERLIVLRNSYANGILSNKVLLNSSGFTVSYSPNPADFPSGFRPREMLETHMVYGVSPKDGEEDTRPLRMPFNRSDYYIKRPEDTKSMPEMCAKPLDASNIAEGVGILYRSIAGQKPASADPSEPDPGGGFSAPYPLLDCVADMQVVHSLDTDGDGVVNLHSDTPPTGADRAAAIRAQVREVRVYILAQEGRKSNTFRYPDDRIWVGETINGVPFGRSFVFENQNIRDWEKYHWRVYTLVVPLGNLN
ncbi:prepilin-type N-terminal cleavage/methylation domain-containing protein [Geobacter sp. DSM 9736]|uniref:prepilin-type N-terminal cleavage/methylation domain-containing protein n=1 Tax=Geobacter sp. DSM 9736 TaxID=1277350 RepID=UPI000B4FF571|nr:prepilin-type N-terminal cleavage/methylation domain-containing protein [Geobacter sp. DSM 9736]SNB46195.1 prepilin-type N-terminal cleavage/methylation domain-containing protein [Geobacter sp. DSM 9736]